MSEVFKVLALKDGLKRSFLILLKIASWFRGRVWIAIGALTVKRARARVKIRFTEMLDKTEVVAL